MTQLLSIDAAQQAIENGHIRIYPSPVKPGILDLAYLNETTGQYELYNNLVVCALRQARWNNAEMQVQAPELIEVTPRDTAGVLRATYRYPAFSKEEANGGAPNQAEMDLVVELGSGPSLRTQLYSRTDVAAAFVGNYYGLQRKVRYLDDGVDLVDATISPWKDAIPTGQWLPGKFVELPYAGNRVVFRGDDGFLQWQSAPRDRAKLLIEIRRTPWLADQPDPGRPWIETVHITRDPFRQGDETWFGYDTVVPGFLRK
jgi:hypothetical protein